MIDLEVYEGYWASVRREKTLIMDKYAEGKIEGDEEATHRIATNLFESAVSIVIVMKGTGLTREQVKAIKDHL